MRKAVSATFFNGGMSGGKELRQKDYEGNGEDIDNNGSSPYSDSKSQSMSQKVLFELLDGMRLPGDILGLLLM
ncbi:hypothetical protein HAX54_001628, partial [Datura stramonium]|nr:hypothetical protein [Datura stramonium]